MSQYRLISPGDVALVESGGTGDFLLGDSATLPAVEVDAQHSDDKEVRVGDVALTARFTLGHTRPGS